MALGRPRLKYVVGAGGAFFGTGVKAVHSIAVPGLAEARGRPPARGRKGVVNHRHHSQHVGEPSGRLGLAEIKQESGERYRVAALVAARPIGPLPGLQVDLERAEPAIRPPRVQDNVFVALDATAGQPAPQDFVKSRQRRAVNSRKIDPMQFHDGESPITSWRRTPDRDRWSSGAVEP